MDEINGGGVIQFWDIAHDDGLVLLGDGEVIALAARDGANRVEIEPDDVVSVLSSCDLA